MKRKNNFFVLPNLLTIVNIFFGYLSILSSISGNYSLAALLILMAAVLDAFDGIIARLTQTQSDLGVHLDSLADAFTFGVGSSLLLYFWGFRETLPSRVAIFFSFIFLIASILRLARYNVLQKVRSNRKYHVGLTVPSGAILLAALVFFHPWPILNKQHAMLLVLVAITISLCMISSIRYRNFLHFNFRQRIDMKTAFLLAVIFSSLIVFPRRFLLIYSSLNLLSGPASSVFNLLKQKIQKVRQSKSSNSVLKDKQE